MSNMLKDFKKNIMRKEIENIFENIQMEFL